MPELAKVVGWRLPAVRSAVASLQTPVALLAVEFNFWSVMHVKHRVQPAGWRTTSAAGLYARDGFRAPPPPFTAFAHFEGDGAVVMLHGELDVASIAILVDCFTGIAFAVDEVVLDFAELDFIDGCGLRGIAAAAQQVTAYGGSVSIRFPHPQIQRLLELVDFDRIVAIQP